MRKHNRHLFYIFLIILLSLICLTLSCFIYFRLCQTKEIKQKTSQIRKVQALPIKNEDIVIKTSYVGHVQAINQVKIIPYISGYLNEVAVNAGQNVSKGDMLVTIDDKEYVAKLDAAKASVLQAEANLNYSKEYYDRVIKSGKRAFSEIDIDKAKDDFLQAEANLKAAKANLALAEVNLGYTQIRAPISGLIGNFDLSNGDYVTPAGAVLLDIVQTNPIRVVFSLTDKEYLNFKNDKALFKDSVIKLTLANGKPFKYDGEFKYSDNEFDSKTNALAVYAYFQNNENELLPNAYVNVDVYKTFKDSVSIDKKFVSIKNNGYFIDIGRKGKIVRKNIQVIAEKDDNYIVKNTFKNGDLIVVNQNNGIPKDTKIQFDISHP